MPAGRRQKGFTLIELLVVIGIISVMAMMLLPIIGSARRMAKESSCKSNLRQVATALEIYQIDYGNGRFYPPWLTLLSQPMREGQAPLIVQKVLICPMDPFAGEQGGRPDDYTWGGSTKWAQYTNTDIDPPDGYGDPDRTFGELLDGNGDDRIPCSYMFEWCAEPCEWVNGSVPDKNEWTWMNGTPGYSEFVRMGGDSNGDNILSWFEVKRLTVNGYPRRLSDVGTRVPMVRCFWHMKGPAASEEDESVLNIRRDYAAYKGRPSWYEDAAH